jgi:8-oxo-dGTP pyrophosphatase MutT (NUDIX family)
MKNKKSARRVICTDIKGKKFKVKISNLTFRPSVYAVIIERGKILLSRQWDGFDFPGGGVDLGENIKKALAREVWEETGIKIAIGRIVFCNDSFFKLPLSGEYVQSILIYYLCKKIGGRLSVKNLCEDEKNYADYPEWIDLKKIKKIKFCNSINSLGVIKEALALKKEL